MGAVTTPARAVPETTPRGRAWTPGLVLDLLLAGLAHLAVLAAWAITVIPTMGLLSIPRRILMNSEWAFDTGRLLPPWVVAVGAVAIAAAHAFFGWAMRRLGRGTPAYGPSVVATFGVLVGVAWGAYNWQPPVMVGRQVGPASGQWTPWGPLAWAAYYARLVVPAVAAAVFAGLLLFSRQSPLRVLAAAWERGRRARTRARRARRTVTG